MNTRSNGFFYVDRGPVQERVTVCVEHLEAATHLRGFKNGAPPQVNQADWPLQGDGQAQANKAGG